MRDMSVFQIDPKKLPVRNILIVILALLLLMQCNKTKTVEITDNIKLLAYESQAKHFATEKNKLGETVNTQETLIVENDKKMQAELLKNSELQKLNTQIKVTSEAKIRNILAHYTQPISHVNPNGNTVYLTSTDTNCVMVGSGFKVNEKWYSLAGVVRKDGVFIDSLTVIDSTTYNLGMKRKEGLKGYFQDWTPTLEVINSNPDINTKSLQNITFKDKPKWYEKRSAWGGIGLGLGTIGTMLLMSR